MIISLFIILLISFSGFVLTYFFAEKETFLWRFAAGNIIGSAIFGLTGFVIANFFGLPALVVSVALLISLAPLALLKRADINRRFRSDWKQGFNKTQGLGYKKFLRVGYYVGFFLLFLIFFDRAMFEMRDGIYTGGSQNLGDLPFHLGAIFSFTEGNNFPPQNPSFANAKFSYPFIADLLTAFFMKFGADVKSAMMMQNVFWAFSLLVILERFVFKLTNNKLAAKIAPVLLFFSGGFGFLWFFKDFFEQSKGFFEFFYNLPRDYTIGEKFRWGNSLVTLFMTQRSLLLGMPLTIIVLQKLWEIFATEDTEETEKKTVKDKQEKTFSTFHFPLSIFYVGLLAGTLPLIHLHSLVVLFVVGVFALILKPEKWREWMAFGVGTGIVAIPALIWAMTGTATRTSEFIAFHFGWDARDDNFFWFWLKNTGIFIPILIFGLVQSSRFKVQGFESKVQNPKSKTENKTQHSALSTQHLLFYLPFVFLFIISITFKLAPWEWDNIKVLIYWFVASLPFAAFALAWIYNQGKIFKIIAVGCLIALTFSGALDVWRVVSNQINYKVFDADSVAIAGEIKLRTLPNALFLNAPTYNSSVVLSGRRSLMRYNGHLLSHGIDYTERETDVKAIYEGNATADILLRKYDIEYILISPEERSALTVNEQYFKKFPVIAEKGQYRIYKVK